MHDHSHTELVRSFTSLGYQVVKIPVRGNLDELEDRLSFFSPDETFIFNNCDGFNGNNMGAVQVIRLIERMGFKHTGATADAIELVSISRAARKACRSGIPTPALSGLRKSAKGNSCWSFR